jgi:hypothetical protein
MPDTYEELARLIDERIKKAIEEWWDTMTKMPDGEPSYVQRLQEQQNDWKSQL